jgi:hypothetical protein
MISQTTVLPARTRERSFLTTSAIFFPKEENVMCKIFLLSDPNDLGKKDVAPISSLSIPHNEEFKNFLKKFFIKETRVARIHSNRDQDKDVTTNIDKAFSFSPDCFLLMNRRKTINPNSYPENEHVVKMLITLATDKKFRAIIHWP